MTTRRPAPPPLPAPTPSRYVPVTVPCPVCATPFTPTPKQTYCRSSCRVAAYRRRQRALPIPVVLPADRPRRPITVYECDSCSARAVGSQRCAECLTFMRKVGVGGACPNCDTPVALAELVDQDLLAGL